MIPLNILKKKIKSIDQKGYGAYQSLLGQYNFPDFRLVIEQIPKDPYAPPHTGIYRIIVRRDDDQIVPVYTENRIQTCRRVLAEYEFYIGKFYFKKGSFESASLRFKDLIRDYRDSRKEPEALYYLALSYDKMGRREQAVSTLKSLVEKFPTIELALEVKELIDSYNMPSLRIKK